MVLRKRRGLKGVNISLKLDDSTNAVAVIRNQETSIIATEFHLVQGIKKLNRILGIRSRCSLLGAQNVFNDTCPVRIASISRVREYSSP
jgi:hypothetical protein